MKISGEKLSQIIDMFFEDVKVDIKNVLTIMENSEEE